MLLIRGIFARLGRVYVLSAGRTRAYHRHGCGIFSGISPLRLLFSIPIVWRTHSYLKYDNIRVEPEYSAADGCYSYFGKSVYAGRLLPMVCLRYELRLWVSSNLSCSSSSVSGSSYHITYTQNYLRIRRSFLCYKTSDNGSTGRGLHLKDCPVGKWARLDAAEESSR